MSKNQIKKNFELSEKLAEFLAQNPQLIKKYPKDSSFVVFSSSDPSLNKINEKLADSLKKKGRKVIKAKKTGNVEEPWVFTPSFM